MADKEHQELKHLPTIADLDTAQRLEIMNLMEELETVVEQRRALAVREDHLKDELERWQKELKKPGFRHGWLIFRSEVTAGRKTLDKLLLLENGCPAHVLNESYKTGSPSTRVIFKRLEEEE